MKKILSLTLILAILLTMSGCTNLVGKKSPLDPNTPVTIVVWHYYNGHIKEQFDKLVNEFNETIGIEQGIVVDAQSVGDVQMLAEKVFGAANKTIGSQPLPDIFAAYPDNAFRVHQISPLVDLSSYFSKEELSVYLPAFLEDSSFQGDEALRVLPIAKSTENLFINNTYWKPFAEKNNLSSDHLSTWEDVYQTAKLYYEQTGKSFLGIDGNANFILMSIMQTGSDPYVIKNGQNTFNLNPDTAKKIWDYFYIPYLHGYYVKTGRFSSDDAKTGTTIAYTGSTAGAAYFPKEIVHDDGKLEPIDALVLPYPSFKGDQPAAISQGAGMCINSTDTAHEYASAEFLKWFTSPKQNVNFAVSTGYFPVTKESINSEVLLSALTSLKGSSPVLEQTLNASLTMFDTYTLYNNKGFNGSYDMRVLLETQLKGKIDQDLIRLKKGIENGQSRSSLLEELTSDAAFQSWYDDLMQQSGAITSQN